MGSYGQDEDLDEYEDDFIDDQDGDVGVRRKYDDEDVEEYEEEEEEEEEVEEEPISEEALKLLKYRQKLKEQLRSKIRKENGGSKSLDQGRRPPISNFGSFFGPSQPVIADRVVQESKALLETRHLAPKASTSQNNVKKVNSAPSTSGAKNGVNRQPPPSQFKSKAQIIKRTRDYSFLLSEDAEVPMPQRHHEKPKNLPQNPDARPASRPSQVPARNSIPSGNPARKVANGYEQRKPQGTPQVSSAHTAPVRKSTSVNGANVVSSDSRRQLDLRKQPLPTKKVGPSSGSGSVRPPIARSVPPKNPVSLNDRRMPLERKAPAASADFRDRRPPVSKQTVPNGRKMPVDKVRVPGRPQERNMSVQHSRDRELRKENVKASNTQMRPPKQSSFRPNSDRDHSRVQRPNGQSSMHRPNGQSSMHSQSGGVRKDSNPKKRRAEEMDDGVDYRSIIRNMFGYDRKKYEDNDDDIDCMEVGFDTIRKEESRSARIARKEDEEELAKIMEEEREEEMRRKRAKMRKMSQR